MKPDFPLITITEGQWLDIIETEPTKASISSINALSKTNDLLIDRNLNSWKMKLAPKDKIAPTTFFFSKVFPILVPVKITWIKSDKYLLDDVKKEIKYCIEKDDDILTQFIEPKPLINKINYCNDFESILKVLNDWIFKTEHNKEL